MSERGVGLHIQLSCVFPYATTVELDQPDLVELPSQTSTGAHRAEHFQLAATRNCVYHCA